MLISFEKLTAKLRSVFGAGKYEITLMHDVYTIKAPRHLSAVSIGGSPGLSHVCSRFRANRFIVLRPRLRNASTIVEHKGGKAC
jgi:hypothetical protein